jgi:hypothetical protein
MQGLSKYYKTNYRDLKRIFEEFFKNIFGIFLKYFPKSNHKINKKAGKYGSCYPMFEKIIAFVRQQCAKLECQFLIPRIAFGVVYLHVGCNQNLK